MSSSIFNFVAPGTSENQNTNNLYWMNDQNVMIYRDMMKSGLKFLNEMDNMENGI